MLCKDLSRCPLNIFFSLSGYVATALAITCPNAKAPGPPPPASCVEPSDPQQRPRSELESWFNETIFNDLFPRANLGHGPVKCRPYNYEAFIIAARYFPRFGTEYFSKDPTGQNLPTKYTADETYKRDVAAFFAHAVQETGENNVLFYKQLPLQQANDCFYRGAFFNWFEGGPYSPLLPDQGLVPEDGEWCTPSGEYCDSFCDNKYFYPCANGSQGDYVKGCYFGRGAIQISYNYNYGLFSRWLLEQGITHNGKPIDILQEPNLVITKTDPPLSIMASLWFYMTPQSPKPAMHDIVVGYWVSPDPVYAGGVFGPTSLVINKECKGEDPNTPGRGGESRRIKAFKWFCEYFGVRYIIGSEDTLSCKTFNNGCKCFDFPDGKKYKNSWDIDWKTSSDPTKPCKCVMETYQGLIPAFDPILMPQFKIMNTDHQKWCQKVFQEGWRNEPCSKYKPN